MPDFQVRQHTAPAGAPDGAGYATLTSLGVQAMMDFYQYSILVGKGFQLRAGTITTPLVGDVAITDTAAEFCVDAVAGYAILPTKLSLGIRLATGTLHEYALKSVDVVSSAGTAFVPLPLRSRGPSSGAAAASACTARVAAAGGVTVTAELATTTRQHWHFANPVAAGAGNDPGIGKLWEPRPAPIIVGAGCLYGQIAATTTGPSYYASLDWIEWLTSDLLY